MPCLGEVFDDALRGKYEVDSIIWRAREEKLFSMKNGKPAKDFAIFSGRSDRNIEGVRRTLCTNEFCMENLKICEN